MSDYQIAERAYTKMLFHAAKYPHLAVNGVLLAEKSTTKTGTVHIVDAIPLFHQCLYLTPMVEVAFTQIDAFAEQNNLLIAGYYVAHENFYENGIEKAPAAKIADKISENYKNACFVVIDNKLVTLAQEQPAVHVYNCQSDGVRWTKAQFALQETKTTLSAVSSLLKLGAMRDIVDFDMYLDNPKHDWTNKHLNRDLQKLLAMY